MADRPRLFKRGLRGHSPSILRALGCAGSVNFAKFGGWPSKRRSGREGGGVADSGRNVRQGYVLLAPTLMVVGLMLAAPLALLLITSLKSQSGIGFEAGWTLAQYGEVLGRESYRTLFARSVVVAAIVTALTVALAYPMAYFVGFSRRGEEDWRV